VLDSITQIRRTLDGMKGKFGFFAIGFKHVFSSLSIGANDYIVRHHLRGHKTYETIHSFLYNPGAGTGSLRPGFRHPFEQQ
jgi:hypothetical protein